MTAGSAEELLDHLLQSTTAIWAIVLGCLLWLIVLTAVVTARCRVDGKPVFKRLPNGRVRFTWGIPQLLEYAQRRADQLHHTNQRHTITVSELQAREQTPKHQRPNADERAGNSAGR